MFAVPRLFALGNSAVRRCFETGAAGIMAPAQSRLEQLPEGLKTMTATGRKMFSNSSLVKPCSLSSGPEPPRVQHWKRSGSPSAKTPLCKAWV